MTRTFSIYLDLVRVSAAVVVLLFHASFDRFGGHWLKPIFGGAGTDGVVTFFVLSGFVIAYTVDTKERTLPSYLVNRLARLWSVAIPALLLTCVADDVGRTVNPGIYPDFYPTDHPFARLASAALFVNELWFWSIQPLSDGPFWSLCYEFWYYMWFGAVALMGGRSGFVASCLAIAIMGPKILLLFPIWLMGVWVYRNARLLKMSRALATAALLSAPVGIFAMHQLGLSFRFQWRISALAGNWLGYSTEFVTANVSGALIAAHFVGFISLEKYFIRLLAIIERPVRFVAGYTLSIYLYHFPLLQLFGALFKPTQGDTSTSIMILSCTLAASFALGALSESRKAVVRSWLEHGSDVLRRSNAVKRELPCEPQRLGDNLKLH